MRIARAHHCAAIFEDLYVPDPRQRTEIAALFHPRVNDHANLFGSHARYRQVVPWREADYSADPSLRARDNQPAFFKFAIGHVRQQRWKIVVEYESRRVGGIPQSR
jgi:hypothetical protein